MNNNLNNLRPISFEEFQGKEDIKNKLKVFIKAAEKEKRQLDHILMHGSAGVGKTTLAQVISLECGKKIKIIQGTRLKKVSDLTNLISLISEGDFLFIDEIHALPIECEETLYSILEDFKIDIEVGPSNNSKIVRVSVPKFTLIGATTAYGKISKPLEDRFGINIFINNYSEIEIFKILKRSKNILSTNIDDNSLKEIAKRSKGIPRLANNILKRVHDFKIVNTTYNIFDIFDSLNIDGNGLSEIDIKYLEAISYNSLSLKTISDILNIDVNTILNKIEPYLINKKMIFRTSRGRSITSLGKKTLIGT